MKNIIIICQDSIKVCTSLYTYLKTFHEKSPYDNAILVSFIFKKERVNLFIYNNINISNRILYDGIIEFYNSEDSISFLLDFEEKFYQHFGRKLIATLRINLEAKETVVENKIVQRFKLLKFKNELNNNNWEEIF